MEKRKFLALPGLELQPFDWPAHSQSLCQLCYPGFSIKRKLFLSQQLPVLATQTKIVSVLCPIHNKDTPYQCEKYNFGLCIIMCFRDYQTMLVEISMTATHEWNRHILFWFFFYLIIFLYPNPFHKQAINMKLAQCHDLCFVSLRYFFISCFIIDNFEEIYIFREGDRVN
jgi:hypothetical protein